MDRQIQRSLNKNFWRPAMRHTEPQLNLHPGILFYRYARYRTILKHQRQLASHVKAFQNS
jgi:hypothetical protein